MDGRVGRAALRIKLPPIWWRTSSNERGPGAQPLDARGRGRASRCRRGVDDRPRRPLPIACTCALLVPVFVSFCPMTLHCCRCTEQSTAAASARAWEDARTCEWPRRTLLNERSTW